MQKDTILYESKNHKNKIIDTGDQYILWAPRGTARFNRDSIVLEEVISAIEQYGNAK